jgi:tetratricopeptide (TPR) repeat protein
MHNLARAVKSQGLYADAEKLDRKVLEIRQRTLGEEHPHTLASMHNLITDLTSQDRYEEAEILIRTVLEIRQRVLGNEHPDTLASKSLLTSVMQYQGRYSEAEILDREVLEIRRRTFGAEHPDTLSSMENLAISIINLGRYAEAERLFREVMEITRRVAGPEHPDTLGSMQNLAASLNQQGRCAEAESLLRDAMEITRRVLGPDHPNTLMITGNLAISINLQGRHAEAEALFREVIKIQRRVLGPEHTETQRTTRSLARLYETWCWELATADTVSRSDAAKAVGLAKLAIELRPDRANTWNNLGAAHYRAGDWQAAVDALEKADGMLEKGDRAHRMFLAMAHWQLGEKEKARQLYTQGAAWIASHAQDDEDQICFRAEAEQLLGISEEERKRLVEQYLAHPADSAREASKEKPNKLRTETEDGEVEKVDAEEPDAGP